jgi:hypothetical protein
MNGPTQVGQSATPRYQHDRIQVEYQGIIDAIVYLREFRQSLSDPAKNIKEPRKDHPTLSFIDIWHDLPEKLAEAKDQIQRETQELKSIIFQGSNGPAQDAGE